MLTPTRRLLTLLLLFLLLLIAAHATRAQAQTAQPGVANTNAAPTPERPPFEEGDPLPFTQQEARAERESGPSAAGLFARTLGALLIVVGLVVAAGWGVKRFGGARFGAPQADAPALAVVASVALGERRSLAVVRFGGRDLLVGATAQSVTLLASEKVQGGETAAPAARSVADMLKADEAEPFEAELARATQQLTPAPARVLWERSEAL